MSYNDDDWAVFWCSLLGPILLDDVPVGDRRRFLKELSQREVSLPNGRRNPSRHLFSKESFSVSRASYLFTTTVRNGNLPTCGSGVGMRRRNDDNSSPTCLP